MQLLVVEQSQITILRLDPMRSLEVLLGNGSKLRQLKTKNATKLRIVDISNTLMS